MNLNQLISSAKVSSLVSGSKLPLSFFAERLGLELILKDTGEKFKLVRVFIEAPHKGTSYHYPLCAQSEDGQGFCFRQEDILIDYQG